MLWPIGSCRVPLSCSVSRSLLVLSVVVALPSPAAGISRSDISCLAPLFRSLPFFLTRAKSCISLFGVFLSGRLVSVSLASPPSIGSLPQTKSKRRKKIHPLPYCLTAISLHLSQIVKSHSRQWRALFPIPFPLFPAPLLASEILAPLFFRFSHHTHIAFFRRVTLSSAVNTTANIAKRYIRGGNRNSYYGRNALLV